MEDCGVHSKTPTSYVISFETQSSMEEFLIIAIVLKVAHIISTQFPTNSFNFHMEAESYCRYTRTNFTSLFFNRIEGDCNKAIKGLNERGGSSLKAIEKYVAAYCEFEAEKVAPFIKKKQRQRKRTKA